MERDQIENRGVRLIDALAPLTPERRAEALEEYLRREIAAAISIDASELGPQDRLIDMGLDSMKAVELKLLVEIELNLELPSSLLFDYPTLEGVCGALVQLAWPREVPAAANVPLEDLAGMLSAELANLGLSPEEQAE